MELLILFQICIYLTLTDGSKLSLQNYDTQMVIRESMKMEQFIFDQCFANKTEPIIILVNRSHVIRNNLFKSGTKCITLMAINEDENFEINNVTFIKPSSVNNFIIVDLHATFFQSTLKKLKNSLWWNHEAIFFVNNGHYPSSCNNAYKFLKIIWDFNILSAAFLCQDLDFQIRLYTFNPYSQYAPTFWKNVRSHKQKNGHTFTLFINAQTILSTGVSSLCKEIWFDKTRDLMGFPIHVAGLNFHTRIREKFTGKVTKTDLFRPSHEYFKIILNTLNANFSFVYFHLDKMGQINDNGVGSGIIGEVLSGKYDICAGVYRQTGHFKNELNSFGYSRYCFIISKDKMTFTDQLWVEFPLKFWFLCITIFIILTILFEYLLKLGYLRVGIDILRGILGSSMKYRPKSELGRLIFIWFIFTFMIVTSYLQTVLQAMLSIAKLSDLVIKTPRDLINGNYKIYSRPALDHLLVDTSLYNNKLFVNDLLECLYLIQEDKKVACIEYCSTARAIVSENDDVHIFTYDDVFPEYAIFLVRGDFPLRNPIELMYIRLYESGIANYLVNQANEVFHEKFVSVFKILSASNLQNICYFIIGAYLLNILVFIIELRKQIIIRLGILKRKLNSG